MMGAFTLGAIDEHDLLDNATVRGTQAKELLRDGAPDHVEDVRGKGLMLAVTFDTADRRDAVVRESLKRGLLTLGCGKKTIRLLPPLDSTPHEIELGVGIFVDAVEAAGAVAKGVQYFFCVGRATDLFGFVGTHNNRYVRQTTVGDTHFGFSGEAST